MPSDIQGGEGLRGPDKRQSDLRDQPTEQRELPEGLSRPRTGPVDKNRGRADAPPDKGQDTHRAVQEGS
jgi:hypothetical protein